MAYEVEGPDAFWHRWKGMGNFGRKTRNELMEIMGISRMTVGRNAEWDRMIGFVSSGSPAQEVEWNGVPKRKGAHWLRYRNNGQKVLMEWSDLCQKWFSFGVSGSDGPERIAAEYDYLRSVPCPPDAP